MNSSKRCTDRCTQLYATMTTSHDDSNWHGRPGTRKPRKLHYFAEWQDVCWRHPGAAHIRYRPHCGWRIIDIPRQDSSARSIGVNDGIGCYRGTPSCDTRVSKQSPPGPIAASLPRDSATSSMGMGTLRIGGLLRLPACVDCLLVTTVRCTLVNRTEWSCRSEPTNQQNVTDPASNSEN